MEYLKFSLLEIFLSLDNSQKEIIVNSIHRIISNLDESSRKKLFLIIPEKNQLGFRAGLVCDYLHL